MGSHFVCDVPLRNRGPPSTSEESRTNPLLRKRSCTRAPPFTSGLDPGNAPVTESREKEVVEGGELGFVKRVPAVDDYVVPTTAREWIRSDQYRSMVAGRPVSALQPDFFPRPLERELGQAFSNPPIAAGITEQDHIAR